MARPSGALGLSSNGTSKLYFESVPETAERRDEDRCIGCGANLRNQMLQLIGAWSWRRGGHYEYRFPVAEGD